VPRVEALLNPTGFTVKGTAGLVALSMIVGTIGEYQDLQQTGILTTVFGERKILDAGKAAQTLGNGTEILYKTKSGESVYTVEKGQFVRFGCNEKKEDCGLTEMGGSYQRVIIE